MIYVEKDYNDIPVSLKSKKVEDWIAKILKKDIPSSYPTIHWAEIKDKLNRLYHGKCAYCESKLLHTDIDCYRSRHLYDWLYFEWSNLLPSCPKCNRHKSVKFPLEDESRRIRQPQQYRNEWRADSTTFLAEKPLLLNPEIDDPENSLAFYPDGRIYGLNKRGRETVKVLGLNRSELLARRKKIIDQFRTSFCKPLEKLISLSKEEIASFLDLAFDYPSKRLLEQTKAEAEFALLGRCMVRDFYKFFMEDLENPKERELLQRAYDYFLTGQKETTKGPVETVQPPGLVAAAVDSLKITNVKCFNGAELQMGGNSTLVIGTNGRGKSTVLQLLALGLSELERPPSTRDWHRVTKLDKRNAGFEIMLNTPDGPLELVFSIDENDTVKCVQNAGKYHAFRDNILVLAYGHGRNVTRQDVPPNKKFEGIASLFGNTGYLKNIRDSAVFSYVEAGFAEIKTLINKLLILADTRYTVELDHFDTEGFYFRTPSAPSREVPLEAMSDGFKSTFVLLFDLVIRAWEKGIDVEKPETITGIVMIDEIDLHLHPSWQRTFLPALQEILPNIQFVITSHSPFIVQSMTTDNIIFLSIDGESVTARKLEMEGKPYGLEIEKIIKNILGKESEVPEISITLARWLKAFEEAVEKGDKQGVAQLYRQIKDAVPGDSDFTEYLDIMSAGLIPGGAQ